MAEQVHIVFGTFNCNSNSGANSIQFNSFSSIHSAHIINISGWRFTQNKCVSSEPTKYANIQTVYVRIQKSIQKQLHHVLYTKRFTMFAEHLQNRNEFPMALHSATHYTGENWMFHFLTVEVWWAILPRILYAQWSQFQLLFHFAWAINTQWCYLPDK